MHRCPPRTEKYSCVSCQICHCCSPLFLKGQIVVGTSDSAGNFHHENGNDCDSRMPSGCLFAYWNAVLGLLWKPDRLRRDRALRFGSTRVVSLQSAVTNCCGKEVPIRIMTTPRKPKGHCTHCVGIRQ